ncbi:hypothetical protein TNCV_2770141 [Trichonephila clavipes]|nr:hypothetical protein TNCV_2770141 [Trichonephila clavipes]
MPTFTITSTSIIRTSAKYISFNSFRFYIIEYHSDKHLALQSSIKSTTQIESQLPELILLLLLLTIAWIPLPHIYQLKPALLLLLINLLRYQLKPYQNLSLLHPIMNFLMHLKFQCVKRNLRYRRKRPKVQKPEIEIKMAPHRPRKATPTELTTDDEDITYDAEEEELETDHPDKFTIKEDPLNFPKGHLRSLTSFRYRNSRD